MPSVRPFAEITIPEFLDVILADDHRADEAMYFLLRQRMVGSLRNRYDVFHRRLHDGFDDVVEDFFLYLRGEDSADLYPSLRSIKNREAFETWILNTFRNYLGIRASKESRLAYTALTADPAADSERSQPTDEQKLSTASHIIAYAHQSFSPRDRFLLLRMLLSLLNRQQALPNEKMAEALEMSAVAYRVAVHRVKRRIAIIRTCLLQGENLPLDGSHCQMSTQINNDFSHLYPTLFAYYIQSIDTLPTAQSVKQLRQDCLNATGQSLHEFDIRYSIAPTVDTFWNMLTNLQ